MRGEEMEIVRLGNRWGQAYHAYLSDPKISVGAKALYALMTSYANATTGACRPTQALLADELGTSTRSIRRWQQELQDAGILVVITKATKHGKSNTYGLTEPSQRTSVSGGGEDTSVRTGEDTSVPPTQQLLSTEESSLRSDSPAPADAETGAKPNAGHLVAAWMEGAEDRGEPVAPTILKRMKGQAANVARDLKTQGDWDRAVLAARAAGEQGLWDIAQGYPVARKSRFVDEKTIEQDAIFGPSAARARERAAAREEAKRVMIDLEHDLESGIHEGERY